MNLLYNMTWLTSKCWIKTSKTGTICTEKMWKIKTKYQYNSEESEKRRKEEAVVRERQWQHQLRWPEQEESEDEHSVFTHVRTMMNQIKQDKARITEIANQVTIKRTVISYIADKMER